MRKNLMAFILIICWSCSLVSAKSLDRNEQFLLGPVKKISTSFVDSKVSFYTNWLFREDGSIESLETKMYTTSIILYDQKGREYRYESIAPDGKKTIVNTLYDDEIHKYTMRYQKNGYLGEIIGDLDKNGNFKDYYKYDPNGVYQGKTVSTYNEDGLLLERNYYNGDNKHFFKDINTYNQDGKLILTVSYNRTGALTEKQELFYDKKGRCIEINIYKQDRDNQSGYVISSKSQMLFDEKDRQVETRNYQYGALGETRTVFRFFDYDKYGNWLHRKTETMRQDGKMQNDGSVLTRIIEYY